MAVIKAVSSKAGIGHAIDYVTKKEKTEEKLVSGLHCEPETVKEEMQATKELWGKTDGRTYKHYPMRRKTPCFSYGDIRRVHRIYASN